jgi:hypothetical protein
MVEAEIAHNYIDSLNRSDSDCIDILCVFLRDTR